MPRFFCDVNGDTAMVTGEDARHIVRALRCRVGESLTLCDGRGNDYQCVITALEGELVTLAVQQKAPTVAEPPVEVTLYQAMPKGDKAELIVQKAVELGAARVVFTHSARCVSRPDEKSMAKKLERLQKVANEAAKQSGRGVLPPVAGLYSLGQTLQEMSGHDASILFYEQATAPLGRVLAPHPRSLAILVGSEGGWEPDEVENAQAAGAQVCTMGPRILRCETAPMFALAAIMYEYE